MSTTPSRAFDEEVAAALLPVLLHRINNTTQYLLAVRALIGRGEMPPRCSGDLAKASESAHEEGWLLGVIAGGLGADLLLARHERDGLGALVMLVRDALRRVQRDLSWNADEIPRLASPRAGSSASAGRVCWTLASLAWRAGSTLPEGAVLALSFQLDGERCTVRGDGGGEGAWIELARAECARLGGDATCSSDGGAWVLELPRGAVERAGVSS
jgi:hypothetical protein